MAKTTFSGPVRSQRGFTAQGANAMVNITAETTLTYDNHVGRIIKVNDADGAITLPTITTDTLGARYTFFVGTDCSDCDIKTDGTDKFVGSLSVMEDNGLTETYAPSASNDVISMNGTTTGGDKGSYIEITAIEDNVYLVQGMLLGSGEAVTPFADS
jgi:hypothetical protein|tara:strand:+ start:105 stop:575 length:471 start_codon:yes stop_codon:yes gene_type:complete